MNYRPVCMKLENVEKQRSDKTVQKYECSELNEEEHTTMAEICSESGRLQNE